MTVSLSTVVVLPKHWREINSLQWLWCVFFCFAARQRISMFWKSEDAFRAVQRSRFTLGFRTPADHSKVHLTCAANLRADMRQARGVLWCQWIDTRRSTAASFRSPFPYQKPAAVQWNARDKHQSAKSALTTCKNSTWQSCFWTNPCNRCNAELLMWRVLQDVSSVT